MVSRERSFSFELNRIVKIAAALLITLQTNARTGKQDFARVIATDLRKACCERALKAQLRRPQEKMEKNGECCAFGRANWRSPDKLRHRARPGGSHEGDGG
jgi:hypothetical protein